MVKQADDVRSQCFVGCEQSDVRVEPCGPHVVIACSDMRVAAETRCLLSDDKCDLRVRLELHYADGHVCSGVLEFRGPMQIALFIESSFEFDDAGDLFAG